MKIKKTLWNAFKLGWKERNERKRVFSVGAREMGQYLEGNVRLENVYQNGRKYSAFLY